VLNNCCLVIYEKIIKNLSEISQTGFFIKLDELWEKSFFAAIIQWLIFAPPFFYLN
jgi:hypothetical protein